MAADWGSDILALAVYIYTILHECFKTGNFKLIRCSIQ